MASCMVATWTDHAKQFDGTEQKALQLWNHYGRTGAHRLALQHAEYSRTAAARAWWSEVSNAITEGRGRA